MVPRRWPVRTMGCRSEGGWEPDVKWFRLYTEARNDAKLRSLSDQQFRVWFNLLCLAAEQAEERGTIAGYDTELLAVEVANGDAHLLEATLDRLQRLRIVSIDEAGTVTFIHFKARQYDKPSDMPEATRERKRRQRERDSREAAERVTPESRANHADVTPSHATDTDTEADTETELTPPSAPSRARARNSEPPGPEAYAVAEILAGAPWVGDELEDVAAAVQRSFGLVPDFHPRDGPYLAEQYVRWRGYRKKPPSDWYRAWLQWLRKEVSHAGTTTHHQRTPNGRAASDPERGRYATEADEIVYRPIYRPRIAADPPG